MLDSESSGGVDADSVGSICTPTKLDDPTKILCVTSIGSGLMREPSSGSQLDSEAGAVESEHSAGDVEFQTNLLLIDFHNVFLFSRKLDMPTLVCLDAPAGAPSLIPALHRPVVVARKFAALHNR